MALEIRVVHVVRCGNIVISSIRDLYQLFLIKALKHFLDAKEDVISEYRIESFVSFVNFIAKNAFNFNSFLFKKLRYNTLLETQEIFDRKLLKPRILRDI